MSTPDIRVSIAQRADQTLERHLGPKPDLVIARSHPFLTLDNRVGVVSGASRGIGRGVAELLTIHGADVVLHGRDEKALEELAEVVMHLGRRAEVVVGDIANSETAAKLGGVIKDKFDGKVDIMVNNAGFANDRGFDKYTQRNLSEISDAISANLVGPIMMTAAVYRGLQQAGVNGRIVNIGSVSGEEGVAGQAVYDASKRGMGGVTKAWGSELLATGGTANMVAYGPVETAIWDRQRQVGRRLVERGGGDPTLDPLQPIADKMISRRFTTVEEAAHPVLYLAGRMGAQTTRQILIVDGGITTLRLA